MDVDINLEEEDSSSDDGIGMEVDSHFPQLNWVTLPAHILEKIVHYCNFCELDELQAVQLTCRRFARQLYVMFWRYVDKVEERRFKPDHPTTMQRAKASWVSDHYVSSGRTGQRIHMTSSQFSACRRMCGFLQRIQSYTRFDYSPRLSSTDREMPIASLRPDPTGRPTFVGWMTTEAIATDRMSVRIGGRVRDIYVPSYLKTVGELFADRTCAEGAVEYVDTNDQWTPIGLVWTFACSIGKDLQWQKLTVTTVEYMLPLCVYQSVSSIQRIEVHLIGSSRSDPYLLFNHVNGHELVTSYAATFPNLVEMHVVKHGGFNVKSCRFMMMGVAVLRRFAREVVYTLRVTYRFSNRLSSETTLETATRLARQMKLQYGANAGIIEQVAEQCHRVKLSDSICLQIDN